VSSVWFLKLLKSTLRVHYRNYGNIWVITILMKTVILAFCRLDSNGKRYWDKIFFEISFQFYMLWNCYYSVICKVFGIFSNISDTFILYHQIAGSTFNVEPVCKITVLYYYVLSSHKNRQRQNGLLLDNKCIYTLLIKRSSPYYRRFYR